MRRAEITKRVKEHMEKASALGANTTLAAAGIAEDLIAEARAQTRREALEEAAKIVVELGSAFHPAQHAIAAAIRQRAAEERQP